MMTGVWAQALSANWERPLDGAYPTLAEQLTARGYATAGFVANTYYCSRESGLARGFAHYDDYDLISWEIVRITPLGKLVLDSKVVRRALGERHKLGRKSAADINRELLSWLDRRDGSRPFFAFLNYFDAHGPYQPRAPFDSLFGAPKRLVNPDLDTRPETWTPEEVRGQSAAYHASIAGLDARLAELIRALEQRGLLDNTLIIVTADHGEEFLEHGVMAHGNSLFRQSVHVPLVMRLPGRLPAGAVVPRPVSLRDIPATVMDLTGHSSGEPFQGRSLARFFTTAGPPALADSDIVLSYVDQARGLPTTYAVSTGALHSVMIDGYRVIEGEDGQGRWYRAEDLAERDTIGSAEIPDTIRQRARAALKQLPLAKRPQARPARP
jgi:arylsulfatase A-like enzyme